MCGIFIVLNRNQKPVDEARFEKAAQLQISRGPDHTYNYREPGFRLSYKILSFSRADKTDVRDEEFVSADGGLLIALNGEIYNWKSLSEEYFGAEDQFRSDTEFLVNFVRLLGVRDATDRLLGMFAFVVYDIATKALTYARDPAGEKFLYKYSDGNSVILSSDIRSITKYINHVEVDPSILLNYLRTRHLLTVKNTCYQNITLVEKGSIYEWNADKFTERKLAHRHLHDLVDENLFRDHARLNERDVRARLCEILETTSRDFLRDGNPTMCVVSGGIDSTLAAASMKAAGAEGKVEGIGISFPRKEETLWRFLDAKPEWRDWVTALTVDRETFQQSLVESYEITRTPLPTHNFPSQLLLARAVREMGFAILISGDGADEAFGGYTAYRNIDLSLAPSRHCPSPYSGIVASELSTLEPTANTDMASLSDGWHKCLETYDFLDQKERVLAATMLCDLALQVESVGLLNADLMNLASSVEGRSFYMHHDVLKFALNLPVHLRINRDAPDEEGLKYILKCEFRDRVGVPPFPKVGYAGFPNEAAEDLLQDTTYPFTSDLLRTKINQKYKSLSIAEKWKINNLELFAKFL